MIDEAMWYTDNLRIRVVDAIIKIIEAIRLITHYVP